MTTYVIERDAVEVGRTDSMTTGYGDRTLQSEGRYASSVRAVDIAGNGSEPTTATVTTPALATVRPIASIPASGSGDPQDAVAGEGPPGWLLATGAGVLIAAVAVLLRPRRALR